MEGVDLFSAFAPLVFEAGELVARLFCQLVDDFADRLVCLCEPDPFCRAGERLLEGRDQFMESPRTLGIRVRTGLLQSRKRLRADGSESLARCLTPLKVLVRQLLD